MNGFDVGVGPHLVPDVEPEVVRRRLLASAPHPGFDPFAAASLAPWVAKTLYWTTRLFTAMRPFRAQIASLLPGFTGIAVGYLDPVGEFESEGFGVVLLATPSEQPLPFWVRLQLDVLHFADLLDDLAHIPHPSDDRAALGISSRAEPPLPSLPVGVRIESERPEPGTAAAAGVEAAMLDFVLSASARRASVRPWVAPYEPVTIGSEGSKQRTRITAITDAYEQWVDPDITSFLELDDAPAGARAGDTVRSELDGASVGVYRGEVVSIDGTIRSRAAHLRQVAPLLDRQP